MAPRITPQRAARETALPVPPAAILVAAFLVLALAAAWAIRNGEVYPDEAAYRFQARIFGQGELAAAAPPGAPQSVQQTPLPLYFEHHILDRGRWFTKYPPGWPLLLAPAEGLGAGWVLNPLLGTALLLVMAAIARRIYDGRVAALAVFLAVLSPFFVAKSIGYMAHPACGVLLAAAALFCCDGLLRREIAPFVWMFAWITAAIQVRPFTAAVVGATLALGALWYLRRERLFAQVLAFGVFFGALSATSVLAYDKIYTGSYRLSPYALFLRNPLTRPGNLPDLDLNPAHMLYQLGHQTRWALEDTLVYTFPLLLLLGTYAVWREKKYPQPARVLAAVFPALVVAHVVQPAMGEGFFGERYYFEGYFAVLILGARGVLLLAERWRTPRRAWVAVLLLLGILEAGQQVLGAPVFFARVQPYAEVRQAAARLDGRHAVFLRDAAPQFIAKHFNLNRADWQKGNLFYMVDPGAPARNEWACRAGRPDWVVLSYNAATRSATEESGIAACP